jgi:aldehyde dehydrogenase (NAD+)
MDPQLKHANWPTNPPSPPADHVRAGIFSDGAWRISDDPSRSTIATRSCADGSPLGTFSRATAADVPSVVATARAAAPTMAALTPGERATILRTLADRLEAQIDTLAPLVAHEVGTPLALSRRLQIQLPATALRGYADAVESFPWSERIGNSEVVHRPTGVVAAITPWNYPIHQVVMKLGAAIAAGCPVVLKPGEIGLSSLAALIDATTTAGLPPGGVNVLIGGPDVAQALIGHPGVDHVSFTGSTRTGAAVAEAAGRRLVPTTLELGGKSASLILPGLTRETTGDGLARAVKASVGNAFLNSGQTCTAWSRLLVPVEAAGRVLDLACAAAEKLTVGHPLDTAARLGPVATSAQIGRSTELAGRGGPQARTVFTSTLDADLPRAGNYAPARIVADVDSASPLAQEEVFGPVLSVLTYRSVDEAVELANDSRFGLTGAVWGDPDEAERIASRFEAGMVDVNGGAFNPSAPFGGWKQSGHGRELGAFGVRELTRPQSIQRRTA